VKGLGGSILQLFQDALVILAFPWPSSKRGVGSGGRGGVGEIYSFRVLLLGGSLGALGAERHEGGHTFSEMVWGGMVHSNAV
jgi:hypothetical protein